MRYKNLGGTGMLVSEICPGTMTFGGKGFWTAIGALDQSLADGIVAPSPEAGVNLIDTVDFYSDGLSEQITGRALVNSGRGRSEVIHAADGTRRAAHDISVARIALAWILHRPSLMSVIIGAKTPEQLDDNLAATEVNLSADERERPDKVSAVPPAECPGWMLKYQSANRFKV
jgi:aryl-alcohol dehydrogenase-like predicted oxidoreductase